MKMLMRTRSVEESIKLFIPETALMKIYAK